MQPTGQKEVSKKKTSEGAYLPENARVCAKMRREAPLENDKPAVGFEPTTTRLQGGSSTTEPRWQLIEEYVV